MRKQRPAHKKGAREIHPDDLQPGLHRKILGASVDLHPRRIAQELRRAPLGPQRPEWPLPPTPGRRHRRPGPGPCPSASRTALAVASATSAERSRMATRAPDPANLRARAWPTPPPPPVITAERPANACMSSLSSRCRPHRSGLTRWPQRIPESRIARNLPIRLDEFIKHLVQVLAILARHGRVTGQHDAVLHDLIAIHKALGMKPILVALHHRVPRDISRENDPAHDPRVFQVELELPADSTPSPVVPGSDNRARWFPSQE